MNIEVIEPEQATGELKQTYERLGSARGKIAKVHKAHSLNPNVLMTHMELYHASMFGESPLSRPQREMLAVVVSSVNSCRYCVAHHGAALNHYWKNEVRVAALIRDCRSADLSDQDIALCEFATLISRDPASCSSAIESLRSSGISDRVIHDAANIAAYFNYVNRIVLGLGVELENDGGVGYVY